MAATHLKKKDRLLGIGELPHYLFEQQPLYTCTISPLKMFLDQIACLNLKLTEMPRGLRQNENHLIASETLEDAGRHISQGLPPKSLLIANSGS